jgi:hypothetical protein
MGIVMFMRANICRAGMYCGAALTAAMSATAVAQTTSTQTGSADQPLEEIVVTSQRRVENLQDVPIAVTALDADALKSNACEVSEHQSLWRAHSHSSQEEPGIPCAVPHQDALVAYRS